MTKNQMTDTFEDSSIYSEPAGKTKEIPFTPLRMPAFRLLHCQEGTGASHFEYYANIKNKDENCQVSIFSNKLFLNARSNNYSYLSVGFYYTDWNDKIWLVKRVIPCGDGRFAFLITPCNKVQEQLVFKLEYKTWDDTQWTMCIEPQNYS